MPDSAVSDESLMQAAVKCDMEAFEQIVLRHQSAAWGVAWRFVGDAGEAQDLVQEAFLRILDAAARYRPTAAFRTYFYRVLTRLRLDHVRKKRPIPADSLPDVPAPGLSPAECRLFGQMSIFYMRRNLNKRRRAMSKGKSQCERPKELAGKPSQCSTEQIERCHGPVKQHPCVKKSAKQGGKKP